MMKKLTFTFLIALMSIGLVHAQIVYEDILILADFEGDPAEHPFTIGGWGSETPEIVENPAAEGINTSSKVLMQVREAGSWNNGLDITFNEAIEPGTRNTLRVKVYADPGVYIYMRPLDAEGNPISEGWAVSPSAAGEWSYAILTVEGIASFNGVRMEISSEWGNTGEDDNKVAYFDEIEVSTAVIPMGEPDRIYMANKRSEVIEIDGFDLEDDWLEVDPTPIENVNFVVEGQTSVPATGSSFRSLWDDEFLFLFVEVSDNSPTPPSAEEWWNYDGIEIFIDGQARNAEGGRLTGQYQIRINYDTETLSGQDAATVSLFIDNGMQWAQGSMPGGYTLEIKVPWLAIHGGEEVGPAFVTFDISIADEDPAIQANRYTNVLWAGVDGSHHPYESSEFWGAIDLDGFVSVREPSVAETSLRVYPSPVADYLSVEMINLFSYEIVNITGAVVKSGIAGSDHIRISTDELNAGLYFLKAIDGAGAVEIKKIIKR